MARGTHGGEWIVKIELPDQPMAGGKFSRNQIKIAGINMTPDERTEALYQILDDAIAEIEEVTDLEGAAPYRAMASYILNRLPTMLCPLHLHDDLSRIAGMFEKASGDLQERSH